MMKTQTLRILSLSLAACITFLAQAQTDTNRLTNADVIKMIKAGLSEQVVIGAVQSGAANYDLSPIGLIDLQQQGVSAKVQEEMQQAVTRKGVVVSSGQPTQAGTSALQRENLLHRVFLIEATGKRELQQNKGEIKTVAAPFFAKVFTKFQGRNADFRIPTTTPVLEFALMGNWVPTEHVKLVKPDIRSQAREITIHGAAGPGVPIKMNSKAYVSLEFEEVRKEDMAGTQISIVRAKPATPLQKTEYVIAIDSVYYCFGVD